MTTVTTVSDRLAVIRDGVKGDKAIIDVTYSNPTNLPTTFFVKFGIGKLSAMRLLCACSEVHECEALYYHHLAKDCPLPTPKCYFVDYHEVSGEFCLLSEHIPFGDGPYLPLKHRVRDAPSIDEQRRFAVEGATLHCAFWGDTALQRGCRRKDETYRRAWVLMQVLSSLGLKQTVKRIFKGRVTTTPFATWRAPADLVGKEMRLILDMPAILTSLCEEVEMTAFGHNDIVTDNAYFERSPLIGKQPFGLFDWQQSCVNSIGQEWAWNWHFLPPEFLTKHEDELISLVLATYAKNGKHVTREDFVRHYVLGCAQMYCFSGGGLQALMGRLDKAGLLNGLEPDDDRCRDGSLAHDGALNELMVGAEMSRRAFTNVCNIMERHKFGEEWERWRRARRL